MMPDSVTSKFNYAVDTRTRELICNEAAGKGVRVFKFETHSIDSPGWNNDANQWMHPSITRVKFPALLLPFSLAKYVSLTGKKI